MNFNTDTNAPYHVVVDEAIRNANIPIINSYGQFLGLNLYVVEAKPVFDNYKKDKEAGKYVLLRCPNFYTAKAIRIDAVDLITINNASDLRIQLNRDVNLRFQLTEPKYKEPSFEAIKLAIEMAETPESEAPEFIYFADLTNLNKELEYRNQATKTALEQMANNILSASQMLENIVRVERDAAKRYAEMIDGISLPKNTNFTKRSGDSQITVTVNT